MTDLEKCLISNDVTMNMEEIQLTELEILLDMKSLQKMKSVKLVPTG